MYRLNLKIKRLFDMFSAGILAVFLLPLWIGVAAAIKKDSKGTIFFRQERRTENGRIFHMLKFRSMVTGAEQMGSGLFNYAGDPRVTRVGRKLRDTSIDELPQLFNIIRGDMSLIGPRPCVVYELGDFDTLNKKYKKRFEMKAGLTGYAQIKGRNGISWDEKVALDNHYIDLFKRYGILIDIKILIASAGVLFKKENIYEKKAEEYLDDAAAAELAEEEIIRLAHLPD